MLWILTLSYFLLLVWQSDPAPSERGPPRGLPIRRAPRRSHRSLPFFASSFIGLEITNPKMCFVLTDRRRHDARVMRANAIGFSWFYLLRRLQAPHRVTSYHFVLPRAAAAADVCCFSIPLVPEYTKADETFTMVKKGERKAFPFLDGVPCLLACHLSWHCCHSLCTLYVHHPHCTHAPFFMYPWTRSVVLQCDLTDGGLRIHSPSIKKISFWTIT